MLFSENKYDDDDKSEIPTMRRMLSHGIGLYRANIASHGESCVFFAF